YANVNLQAATVDIKPWAGFQTTIFQNNPNAQLQFDLSGDLNMDICQAFYLRLVLSNANVANPCSLILAPFLFTYFQLFFGNTLLDQIQNVSWWQDIVLVPKWTSWEKEANGMFVNPTTYQSTLSIPASSSLEVFIPLRIFWGQQEVELGLLQKIQPRIIF